MVAGMIGLLLSGLGLLALVSGALFDHVVRRLEEGQGSIITLAGEPGIGKSRLLAEWRLRLGERVRWLEGRCFAHTNAVSFGTFLDLLRRKVGITGEQPEPNGGVAGGRAAGAGQRAAGDQPGVRLGHQMGREPVITEHLRQKVCAEEGMLPRSWPAASTLRSLPPPERPTAPGRCLATNTGRVLQGRPC